VITDVSLLWSLEKNKLSKLGIASITVYKSNDCCFSGAGSMIYGRILGTVRLTSEVHNYTVDPKLSGYTPELLLLRPF